MANINQCDECKQQIDGQPEFTMGNRDHGGQLKVLDFCSNKCRTRYAIKTVVVYNEYDWPATLDARGLIDTMATRVSCNAANDIARREAMKAIMVDNWTGSPYRTGVRR